MWSICVPTGRKALYKYKSIYQSHWGYRIMNCVSVATQVVFNQLAFIFLNHLCVKKTLLKWKNYANVRGVLIFKATDTLLSCCRTMYWNFKSQRCLTRIMEEKLRTPVTPTGLEWHLWSKVENQWSFDDMINLFKVSLLTYQAGKGVAHSVLQSAFL